MLEARGRGRDAVSDSDAPAVLMLIDHLGTGGAQEHVYQLCHHLADAELRLSVCALHTAGHYAERIRRLGVPVEVLSPARRAGALPGIAWRLARALRSGAHAVLHTFLEASFVLGTPLARLGRVPTLHSITSLRAQLAPWYLRHLVRSQRWVNAYLTGIESEELVASGVDPGRVKQAETLIDLSEPLALAHDPERRLEGLAIPPRVPVALSVGRLIPDKGHEYAIRAWPRVVAALPEARLLVVGDGGDEARLRRLAARCQVAERVHFTGYRGDLMALFARADCFLRTSIVEGMNTVTSQAMAAGVPIVAFSTPVPKDFVVHARSGWVAPLADAGGLAEGVLTLLRDSELAARLAHTARDGIRAYASGDCVIATHERLYRALARGELLDAVPDMRERMWPASDPFHSQRRRVAPVSVAAELGHSPPRERGSA